MHRAFRLFKQLPNNANKSEICPVGLAARNMMCCDGPYMTMQLTMAEEQDASMIEAVVEILLASLHFK
jgi:hypothetical protein